MHERYFDNAATTPVDPRVVDEMLPFFMECPGNASSIHQYGRRAFAAVEEARERVATLIGAEDPSQIIFTSGATESNNWVISQFDVLQASSFEHSSVLQSVARRESQAIRSNGSILNIQMKVNNETGTVFEIPDGGDQYWLVDATQAIGKLPISLGRINFLSGSAHKLYGPKGVGLLYVANPPIEPFLVGGEQEFGMRGSTLNVPGIVGFGLAAQIALDEMEHNYQLATKCQQALLSELDSVSDWQINGAGVRSPYIVNLSFLGIEGESLLIELDAAGFCCSAGAACSSRSSEPSHTLVALGLEPEWIRGSVRVSFGKYNTVEASAELGRLMKKFVNSLRNLS